MSLAITDRHQAAALVMVLLAMLHVVASDVLAQGTSSATPMAMTPEAAVRAVLEKHCASCHQSERTAPAPPKSALRHILDLDALAREPGWVLPGNPDGSRLVQMMMWRHLDPQPPEPNSPVEITPEETAVVRGWVKGLPRAEPCAVAQSQEAPRMAMLIAKAAVKAGPRQAKDMRFVSLAAPYNACASREKMAVFRAEAAQMLNSLSWAAKPIELDALDDDGALLAFRLADLGWSDAHWTAIVAASPYRWASPPAALESAVGTRDPVVNGGWLVGALAAGPLFESLVQLPPRDGSLPGIDIAAERAKRIARHGGRTLPLELAISYRHRLDLARLAAEFGGTAEALATFKAAVSPDLRLLAQRARQGSVPREDVEDAFLRHFWLSGRPRDEPPAGFVRGMPVPRNIPEAIHPPDIVLLADKPMVQVGEKVSFTVTTSHDCHLTIVNVDTLGRATVLFPNEFEPESRIQAGRTLHLPPEGAGYELRARQPGTEAMVATCNPVSTWAAGISHDFERQRFTVLGDYEAFVRKSLAPDTAAVAPRVRRRVQRRGRPTPPPPVQPLPGQIGRTGILVDVRP